MIIVLKNQPGQLPPSLIIPLLSGDTLPGDLSRIAELAEVPLSALQQEFSAEPGEVHTLYHNESRLHLLGLGKQPEFSEILKAFRSFAHKYNKHMETKLGLGLTYGSEQLPPDLVAEAAANGLLLGTYQAGRFKKDQIPELHPLRAAGATLELLSKPEDGERCQKAAERGAAIAHTQLSIIDLVNAPSNKKTPTEMAAWAERSGQAYGYQVQVMDQAAIEETGLHALLAVNRGSEEPPAFIIMEYQPKQPPKEPIPKVGLVGKGVTFDTGGLSIKPSSNMHYMKSDMGGAAAVFGTLEVAAKLQLPVHLIGIVPATDNCVDAKAIKPGDVIDSYSGKTIEVIDTDAEGRLILSDAIAYMLKHYKPEVLIDLATLTGSAVRTFGYHAGALFANNDGLAEQLYEAGQRTGERIWRLPIWDAYKEDIKSDVADVKNFSGKPLAGAIGAAKFLEAFIGGHQNWAHLDIAGVAFGDSEFTLQKSATGFGPRLLIDFLEHHH